MTIRIGADAPSAIYIGSQAASAVYVGGTQVWPVAAPPLWSPLDVAPADRLLWLDAQDAAATVFSSGTRILTWGDSFGVQPDFTATSANPTLSADAAIGGLRALRLENPTQMSMSGAANIAGATRQSYFAVLRLGGVVGANAIPFAFFGNSLYIQEFGNNLRVVGLDQRQVVASPPIVSDGDYHVFGAIFESGGQAVFTYDGAIARAESAGGLGGGAPAVSRIDINHPSVPVVGGALAEWFVFNTALNETDRRKAEGYLAHKYGLAANLPATHPYKSAAP